MWYVDDHEPLLKQFCATAHKQADKGSYTVDWVIVRARTLLFKDPRYLTRQIDVVEYSIAAEGEVTPWMDSIQFEKMKLAGERWAITQGRQRDCVYYLHLENNETGSNRSYTLQEEVCGITGLPTPPSMFL